MRTRPTADRLLARTKKIRFSPLICGSNSSAVIDTQRTYLFSVTPVGSKGTFRCQKPCGREPPATPDLP